MSSEGKTDHFEFSLLFKIQNDFIGTSTVKVIWHKSST